MKAQKANQAAGMVVVPRVTPWHTTVPAGTEQVAQVPSLLPVSPISKTARRGVWMTPGKLADADLEIRATAKILDDKHQDGGESRWTIPRFNARFAQPHYEISAQLC